MADFITFSTEAYWDTPAIQGIIRRYLADHQVSEAGIEWILRDLTPRLMAISGTISVEVPDSALKTANSFVAGLHKMTSKMLVEFLKIEIDLYKASQL